MSVVDDDDADDDDDDDDDVYVAGREKRKGQRRAPGAGRGEEPEKKPGCKREKTKRSAEEEEGKAVEKRDGTNSVERALFSRVVPRGAASRRCCSSNGWRPVGFCAAAIRCRLLS